MDNDSSSAGSRRCVCATGDQSQHHSVEKKRPKIPGKNQHPLAHTTHSPQRGDGIAEAGACADKTLQSHLCSCKHCKRTTGGGAGEPMRADVQFWQRARSPLWQRPSRWARTGDCKHETQFHVYHTVSTEMAAFANPDRLHSAAATSASRPIVAVGTCWRGADDVGNGRLYDHCRHTAFNLASCRYTCDSHVESMYILY